MAVTYDDFGDRTPRLYINGNEVTYQNQQTVTGTLKYTTIPVIIGNRISGNRSFQEIIDEVKIYNRAFSATEIQNVFKSQNDQLPPAAPMGLMIQ